MKKMISLWTNCTVFMVCVLLFPAAPCFAADYVALKNDGVNIRSGPNTKAEKVYIGFAGYPLKIVETVEAADGKWVKVVDCKGDTGWVFNSLTVQAAKVIINLDNPESQVNLRTGPGSDYEILAKVADGVVFDFVEKDGDWYKVSSKNEDGTLMSGWVDKKFVWPNDL